MLSDGERMLGGLLRSSHTAALEDIVPLLAQHAPMAGFSQPVVYVADLQQRYLVPLPGQYDAVGSPLTRLRIDSTVAGRAFRYVRVEQTRQEEDPALAPGGGPIRLWVPMLDGTERIGVLGANVPAVDETVEWRLKRLATLLSLLVVSKREFSDTYRALVRSEPMALSAEVLWNLLPDGSFANEFVVLGAALEPAYQVGGDAYDFGIRGDTLHLSIFDAMGHDLAAGLTASIAMGACRNSRLEEADPLKISEEIDAVIADHFRLTRFATGIIGELNMRSGELTWINRGHHPPLVLRRGRLVATLEPPVPSPPMGFRLRLGSNLERYQLEPGDRLVLYTDGIVEARSPQGEVFGLERFVDFIVRREADGLSVPETLRRLIQTILEHQRGGLQDDAAVLVVEWQADRKVGVTL